MACISCVTVPGGGADNKGSDKVLWAGLGLHGGLQQYLILFNIILTYTVSYIMVSALKYACPGTWAGTGVQH